MKLLPDCVPCTMFKVVRLIRAKTNDEAKVVQGVQGFLEIMETPGIWESPPARLATLAHKRARAIIGDENFLAREKAEQNKAAIQALGRLEHRIGSSEDPVKTALLLSVAGNIVDLGASPDYDLDATLERILSRGFARDDYPTLSRRLRSAESVLLIADNAGEIVFDLFFMHLLAVPTKLVSVRERPFLNDATLEDVRGLPHAEEMRFITPGSDTLGVDLSEASEEFLGAFDRADVVIAKGHANLESLLSNGRREVFFASMIKCEAVARFLGVPKDSAVLFLEG